MLKVVSAIFHWFVILIVGTALMGVNVVQLYCMCCDESCLHVEVVPLETECSCQGHGHHEEEGDGCCSLSGKEYVRHDFYKVAGFSFDVKNVLPAVFSGECVSFLSDFRLWPSEKTERFADIPDLVPDEPPSQELLCTYLC